MLQSKKSESKAWKYLRKILDNDEQYFSLKNNLGPIELIGNKGGKYFLYPNGQLARIDTKEPRLGMLRPPKEIPLPDFMVTLIMWIRNRDEELKKNWACGNLSFTYDEKQTREAYAQNIRDFNELTGGLGATCMIFHT